MLTERLLACAARLRGSRILVTGAAGFVGANLLRILVEAGCEPHGLIRPGGHAWRLEDLVGKVVLHEADLTDEPAFEAVFSQVQPEYVFHLATPRGSSQVARDEMLRFNVAGSVFLGRLVSKYWSKRLVVAGSSLEYAPSAVALTESSAVAPLTWHGTVKSVATLMYQYAAHANALPVVLLRLFHVYGPWESAHRLGPTAIRSALDGAPLHLTEPGIRRDWVFVDDVCEALLLAVDRGGNGTIFNIGTGVDTANEALVACVEAVTGCQIKLAPGVHPRRVTDAEHRFADSTLARHVLGWLPQHDLEAGLRHTVAWYRANPQAWANDADVRPAAV